MAFVPNSTANVIKCTWGAEREDTSSNVLEFRPRLPDHLPLSTSITLLCRLATPFLRDPFGSRITSNIRENKDYIYSPFGTIQNHKTLPSGMNNAEVTSVHTGVALQKIVNELKTLPAEPPQKTGRRLRVANLPSGGIIIN